MALSERRALEIVLYGPEELRRFTQDMPVQFDVWLHYLAQPYRPQSLLLEPWEETPVFQVAQALATLHHADSFPGLIYNRRQAEVTLGLSDLVRYVLPLTGGYERALRQAFDPESSGRPPYLPERRQLWSDLSQGRGPEAMPSYRWPRLLPMIRVIGYIGMREGDRSRTDEFLERLVKLTVPSPIARKDVEQSERDERDELQERAAEYILNGWHNIIDVIPAAQAEPKIYAISRNRPAFIAQKYSIRTVKSDAAHAVFDVNCSNLTWAVIDSGIDAMHPAFVDATKLPDPDNATQQQRLKASRVRETYDFSGLRDLLLGNHDNLPAHYRIDKYAGAEAETIQRIEQARPIDWELLRPILRIEHDNDYAAPKDSHGTHVAGILGGNWAHGRNEVLRGVCPDIRLIDIRVCDDYGRSNEFVIVSALQFLRHLNANAERMAVHGANMSLSLLHDAASFACGRTPVCVEAERNVSAGMVVVAAAGNQGYRRLLDESNTAREQYIPVSITDPGNAEAVITVGATHRMEPHTYGVSYFSSRGPTGDGRIKPDLVAPGEKIYAPSLDHRTGVTLDGTSMAAPHVSGAAAMLMARHVELVGNPARIKAILCATATDLGRERYFQGHGLLDILRAMQAV